MEINKETIESKSKHFVILKQTKLTKSDSFKFESKATGSFWALGKLSKVWHMSCLVPHDVDFTEMGFTPMLAAPGKLRFSHPKKMMMSTQQSRVHQKLDSNLVYWFFLVRCDQPDWAYEFPDQTDPARPDLYFTYQVEVKFGGKSK